MIEIIDAMVIVTCPRRNFVALKIVTEDGTYGRCRVGRGRLGVVALATIPRYQTVDSAAIRADP